MLGSVTIFIPAISRKKMEKGRSLSADSLYLDLEDSVAPEQKTEARQVLLEFLAEGGFQGKNVWVRINPVGSDYWEDDVDALSEDTSIRGLLLPNADLHAAGVLAERLDQRGSRLKMVLLVETAKGLEEAREAVLASGRIVGIQFGAEDYTASMDVQRTMAGDEILFARFRLANLAHAYGLEILDTPFTAISELDFLRRDSLKSREMGFTGRAVIHPSHIDIVRRVFMPDEADIEKARQVLAAYGEQTGENLGVFKLNGRMVDAPVLQRARNTLKRAGLPS